MNWLYIIGYLLIGTICAVGIVFQSYRKDAPFDDAFAVFAIVLLWPMVPLAVSVMWFVMWFGYRIIHIGEKIYFMWRKRK